MSRTRRQTESCATLPATAFDAAEKFVSDCNINIADCIGLSVQGENEDVYGHEAAEQRAG